MLDKTLQQDINKQEILISSKKPISTMSQQQNQKNQISELQQKHNNTSINLTNEKKLEIHTA
jgi:hypothetical protein